MVVVDCGIKLELACAERKGERTNRGRGDENGFAHTGDSGGGCYARSLRRGAALRVVGIVVDAGVAGGACDRR